MAQGRLSAGSDKGSIWRSHLPVILGSGLVMLLLASLRPDYMEHWDEIQLTLGLDRFDLISHHPHPPGYYLFVKLGKVLEPLVSEPADALRLISVFATGVMVGLMGWMFPSNLELRWRLGLFLAVVVFVFGSPMVLPYGVVALTYASEAACWLGILVWLAHRPRGMGLVALAVFMGACAGLRQTLAVWGPAVLFILAARDRSWVRPQDAVRIGLGFLGGLLLWFVPMLVEVGGWGQYAEATKRIGVGNIWSKSVFAVGLHDVISHRLPRMLADLWTALGPVTILFFAALVARWHPRTRSMLARWDAVAIGGGTAFVFYLLLIYDSSGYILPVAMALAAYGFVGMAVTAASVRLRNRPVVVLGAVAATVVLCFLPGGLAARDDAGYRRLLRHDEMMARRIEAVRRNFDPGNTLLVTSREYWTWSFRHVMYYLPEFTTMQLVVDPFMIGAGPRTPYLVGRHRQVRHAGPDGLDVGGLPEFNRPHGLRYVVYMIPEDVEQFVDDSCQPILRAFPVGPDESLAVFEAGDDRRVRVVRGKLVCRRYE
jgi:hypothetical protein